MLKRRGGLREEDEARLGCVLRGSGRIYGEVRKDGERPEFAGRGRGDNGRIGRRRADERCDRWWWVYLYEASSALSFISQQEGRQGRVEKWKMV